MNGAGRNPTRKEGVPIMLSVIELRNLLMAQHGWNRRVATMAARLYNGIDNADDLASAELSEYGRPLLSQSEYAVICRCR
jgi:hypothetical protein